MRILFFGDIHFKLYGSIPSFNRTDESGLTYELRRAIDSMRFVTDMVVEYEPDLVVCLGDVFHSLYTVDSPVMVQTINSFRNLYDLCRSMSIPFWIISGNHDKYSSEIYSTSILPADINLWNFGQIVEFMDHKFLLVPYTDEPAMYNFMIDMYDKVDYIFTHMTFNGAYVNDKKSIRNDFSIPNGDIKIISGHIHKHQILGSVLYVGSLYQQFPSDSTQVGVCVFDTESRQYEFIPNTYTKLIVTVTDENIDVIEDLDPELHYIRLFVSGDLPDHIGSIIQEFEHSIFHRPKFDGGEKVDFSVVDIESPDTVIKGIIESDYRHLKEIYEELS